MDLKLQIKNYDLTWTLEEGNTYTVGTNSDCEIPLSYESTKHSLNLEISYDTHCNNWFLRDLGNSQGVFIKNKPIGSETIWLRRTTHIKTRDGFTLTTKPKTDMIAKNQANNFSQKLTTSTRLLSGYAYLKGLFSGFELLNYLRSDRYKAKVPRSSLDVDQITTHATQSVLISLVYAVATLTIFGVQIVLTSTLGFNLVFIAPLALLAGSIMSYEIVYLRWNLTRGFLKRNYKPDSQFALPPLFQPTVNYFRQQVYQSDPAQNIITFGGSHPFVGYGELINESSWTLPIDRKPADNQEQTQEKQLKVDIPVAEFYETIDQEIAQLNLPNITKHSRLFVDGFELEADAKILTESKSRPAVLYVDDPLSTREQTLPGSKQRAYRIYQYVDAERDYVFSHLLRFYNAGSITFVESAGYILTGIDREHFTLTSTLDDDQLSIIIKTIIGAIILTCGLYVPLAIWYLGMIIANMSRWQFKDAKQKRAAEFKEEYNYGPELTLREIIAEPLNLNSNKSLKRTRAIKSNSVFNLNRIIRQLLKNPILLIVLVFLFPVLIVITLLAMIVEFILNRNRILERDIAVNLDYYGTQDLFMYWKAIQDAIFAGTVKVFKRYGVDTTSFEQTAAAIINNGVMMMNQNNTGVNISGVNSIINSQISGGEKSNTVQHQTIMNNGTIDETKQLIESLRQQIQALENQAVRSEAQEQLNHLEAEIDNSPTPDKSRLKAFLIALWSVAKDSTLVANAAMALAERLGFQLPI